MKITLICKNRRTYILKLTKVSLMGYQKTVYRRKTLWNKLSSLSFKSEIKHEWMMNSEKGCGEAVMFKSWLINSWLRKRIGKLIPKTGRCNVCRKGRLMIFKVWEITGWERVTTEKNWVLRDDWSIWRSVCANMKGVM